jgi:Tfp pilus assembly protein PilE
MASPIAENSILFIALTSWAPTIFTVAVGGFLASILFPRWQQSYQLAKQTTEKRLLLAEQVAKFMNRYFVAWRRLIQISTLERDRALSPEEAKRKEEFVIDRNQERDALHDHLSACHLYFSENTSAIVSEFCLWDEGNSAKRLAELPPLSEWRNWERRVLTAMKNDLSRHA